MSTGTRPEGVTREPWLLVTVVVLSALLLAFVLLPLAATVAFPRAGDWAGILSGARYRRAAANSLISMAASTATATLFGFLFAFTAMRTTVPLRRLFRGIALLPLFSPPFMVAFSYVMMFGGNGLITHGLLGVRASIFGWPGLWLSQTISFFPVAALIIESALRAIPPSVENAARNLGASGGRLLRTVLLPLALPGIAGAALLVAIQVLADFGNPIMIGGNFSVLATEAWLRVEGWGDVRGAAVLSVELLVPAVVLFVVQRRWVAAHAVPALGTRASLEDLPPTGRLARAVLFTFCLLVSLLVLLVYAALVMGAFVKGWGFDWTPTLANFRDVVGRGPELLRSLAYAGVAGLLSALLSVCSAWLVSRRQFAVRRAIDLGTILPAALPGISFGIGYAIVFGRPPADLYGTAAIVVLSLLFWNISMGHQSAAAALSQVPASFGEAASNLGASSLRILREIEGPLLGGTLFSAFTVSFIRAITTLSVVVFLATSSNRVATITIMNLVTDGFYGKAAALTAALLACSFLALGAARLAAGRPVELFTPAVRRA
ncbi:MAG TPA: iron ABC transporter permease [Spirochaetia bacterium]|nr:iron ABC transporter permease [Spirochaetia bacterium]